jgi:hypothetical protein
MPINDSLYKIEEFTLPDKDKTIVEIVPIVTDDMDLLLQFMELAKKADRLKLKETKTRKKTGDISDKEVTESIKFTFTKLNPVADKIIDKGTRIKDKFNLVPIVERKDGIEVDGIIYNDVEVPILELVDGIPTPKMRKETIPLPAEYRNIANRIQLTQKIVEISMGDVSGVVEGKKPLEPVAISNE